MKKILFIIVICVILFIVLRKTKIKFEEMINDELLKENFKKILEKYGVDIARNVEKIFRLETAHFKSGGFKHTLGAGMEIFKPDYPYGWTSLKTFWDSNPTLKPISKYTTPENQTGIKKTFLVFPTLFAGLSSVAEIMKKRGNNAGSWYALDKDLQNKYNAKISQIKTSYT